MRWAALILLALAMPAAVDADVQDYVGRPIESVRFEIEGRPAGDDRLARVVTTRVGDPLSLVAVRETIMHLLSLGRFDDVVVEADPSGSGVALLYALTPVHLIEVVSFEPARDLPGASRSALRRLLRDRFGPSPPSARADEMTAVVEGELRARGYLHPVVTPRVDLEHAPDRAVLVLAVAPGGRTVIGAVEVIGDPGIPPSQLIDRLGARVGRPYEPQAFAERIQEYLAERRAAGHFQATLTLTATFDDEDRVVRLGLRADQGPRVQVAFEGDTLPSGRLDELVPLEREGSADEDLLEDSSNRIVQFLRGQGYRDAVVAYRRETAGANLRVVFTVTRGLQYRLRGDVEVSGNESVPVGDFAGAIGLRAGQVFVAADLDADVAAVEDIYRRRGFAGVEVRAGVDVEPSAEGQGLVTVRMLITEHARTLVGSIEIADNVLVPDAQLLAGLGLQPGRPFEITQLAIDRDTIQQRYADLGFQRATVETNAGLSDDGARADVVFRVREGPRLAVSHVLIVGNDRTREDTIRRELQLGVGDPLGVSAVLESQRRLSALGLFRRIRVSMLDHGKETERDLLVTVDEAPVTTIGYGGGLEGGRRTRRSTDQFGAPRERIEIAPRAFFEVSRRNLFGKNRSVSLFTRVSLRPEDATSTGDRSGYGFSEYRILGTFREPRVIGSAADALLTGTIEQQIRPSFNFARRALNAEVGRALTRTFSASGSYQIQRTELFDERLNPEDQRLIDRLFPQVRLSSFGSSVVRDTRNDQLDPATGHYASVNTQVAARRIGSEVGFVRSYLTGQWFHPLTAPRVVLATSARLGLATGFPRGVTRRDANGDAVLNANGQPVVDVVEDLPASERFFAGGDTTVRGFALDQLGTPATLDQEGFPVGGNGLVIFNAELRIAVGGGLGVVGFVDAGNVFARASDLALRDLRGAVGVGLRYASPVGPIRVDLGFKTDRRDLVPGRRESLTALHISLGQAF